MPKLSSAVPTRQRRKEARPQELLDAALELFVEKGFAATRSDEVAVRAGVSKGTLYLYYPSKEELLKAVIQQNLAQLIAEGAGMADEFVGSSAELLATLMRTWWERVGNTPAGGIHKVVMTEVRNFPEIAQFYRDVVISPANDLLIRTLRRGIEAGEFREVPVEQVTQVLFAPLIFLALHKHSFGACPAGGIPVDADSVITTHLDLVLHGLLKQETPLKGKQSS
ncbi:TetR/AcrR family transcriptional regulator [Sphaerotilaceae bacterium SBD11-9]